MLGRSSDVTGVSRQACTRSLMRSAGPQSETSSANWSGTAMTASPRLPSMKRSWNLCASASKPMRLISSMWNLRFFAPMPPT
jgi:hypothetical protein